MFSATKRPSGQSAIARLCSWPARRGQKSSGWPRSSIARCSRVEREGAILMRIRWVIAVVGVAALAALTVTTQMPWLAKHETTMVQPGTAAGGEGGDSAAAAMLSCPADAKPANLSFTMKDVAGKNVTLADFKGKVVLLDFWATWCGPCKVEIPHFIEMQKKYGPQGLQIVGLSMDDDAKPVREFVQKIGINYPVAVANEDIAQLYGGVLGL